MKRSIFRSALGFIAGVALWLALVGCTSGNGDITPSPQTAPTQTVNASLFATQKAIIRATLTAPVPQPKTPGANVQEAGR